MFPRQKKFKAPHFFMTEPVSGKLKLDPLEQISGSVNTLSVDISAPRSAVDVPLRQMLEVYSRGECLPLEQVSEAGAMYF